MDRVPEVADTSRQHTLYGQDHSRQGVDRHGAEGDVTREQVVRPRSVPVLEPVPGLIDEKRNEKEQPADGMQQHRELVRHAEGQEPDGQSGDRLEQQQPGDEDRETRAPFARPSRRGSSARFHGFPRKRGKGWREVRRLPSIGVYQIVDCKLHYSWRVFTGPRIRYSGAACSI